MEYRTRFAPCPNGYLHIGNARTALVARNMSKYMMLRIDNTTYNEREDEYIESIIEDLKWLRIDYDTVVSQRPRFNRYDEVMELILSRIPFAVYFDGGAIRLKTTYKIFQSTVGWNDLNKGQIFVESKFLPNPVLKRSDGSFTYMFASVVDDIDFDMNLVVRGDDHITNTATQILLFQLIGLILDKQNCIPNFYHLPLIHVGGEKISKTNKKLSGVNIKSLRIYEPETILDYLSELGTTGTVSFDSRILNKANKKYILKHDSSILNNLYFPSESKKEEFWSLIKHNISTISDIKDWYNIVNSITPEMLEHCKHLTEKDARYLLTKRKSGFQLSDLYNYLRNPQ